MADVCVHQFDDRDPRRPSHSMAEVDLAARLGLSIVRNIEADRFEIQDIHTHDVRHSGQLEHLIEIANELEGASFIEHGCGRFCPQKH